MIKRSITIHGHRTSISLEHVFWDSLVQIAANRGISISALVAEIDSARTEFLKAKISTAETQDASHSTYGLSSMIRIYVLRAALSGDLKQANLDHQQQ
jgi:predicted DNA-binding ribbon-helix-helix protein